MAAQMGVNLRDVQGTGPVVGDRNRVLERDLLGFLGQSPSAQSTTPAAAAAPARAAIQPAAIGSTSMPGGLEERKPVRGLRRVIAQAMVRSKFTAPHYAYVDKFECSNLVTLREEVKVLAEKQGVKVTYLAFIVKALVAALKEFPVVNSSLEEGPGGMELVLKKYYNIGIAVATPDGLVVPVIKNADKKSLIQIAKEMTELSEKTRTGKATADELKGSTFTITSMGNVGGLFATPIINYPEVGIMGVYKVVEEPIVKNSQIVIGKTMHLSLSLDHRVVDGTVGAQFCNAVIARLQDPARLFMELV
jgi:pyruvate dehydrogenase E2 component (dihydrolipoamide acetyltransferase)